MIEALAMAVGRWVTPRRFGWTAAAGIVLLGLVGTLHTADAIDAPAFDLDEEYVVPSVFSAALLGCAAIFAVLYGAVRVDGGPRMRPAAGLGALFLFLSADEFGQLHERLEDATGIDFMVLYAPLILACGVAWLLVLRRMWPRKVPRLLFVGGAAAWVVAQALEDLQWNGAVPADGYELMMVPEELLEFAGNWMFCVALLMRVAAAAAVSRAASERAADGRAPSRAGR